MAQAQNVAELVGHRVADRLVEVAFALFFADGRSFQHARGPHQLAFVRHSAHVASLRLLVRFRQFNAEERSGAASHHLRDFVAVGFEAQIVDVERDARIHDLARERVHAEQSHGVGGIRRGYKPDGVVAHVGVVKVRVFRHVLHHDGVAEASGAQRFIPQ